MNTLRHNTLLGAGVALVGFQAAGSLLTPYEDTPKLPSCFANPVSQNYTVMDRLMQAANQVEGIDPPKPKASFDGTQHPLSLGAAEAKSHDTHETERIKKIAQYSLLRIVAMRGKDSEQGTAFQVRMPGGGYAAVTAGHVVGTSSMDNIYLTSADDGEPAHPIGGCYELDNAGERIAPAEAREHQNNATDFAILRLRKPIAQMSLKLATHEAPRGTAVTYVNYQRGHSQDLSDPAGYTGVVVSRGRTKDGLNTVFAPVKSPRHTNAKPGSSGGPMIDEHLNVVGVSTHAVPYAVNANVVERLANLSSTGSNNLKDRKIQVAHGMPVSYIRRALRVVADQSR